MKGFRYMPSGQALEKVNQAHSSYALLAKAGDFEVMEMTAEKDREIILFPAEDDTTIEFFYILEGEIEDMNHQRCMGVGDLYMIHGLESPVHLTVRSDCRVLYVVNESFFIMISEKVKDLVKGMEEIGLKDAYTKEHCERVVKLAIDLAYEIGLDRIDVEKLNYAAIFHDIGKLKISDEILLKKGKLTDEEYEIIKTHPTEGLKYVDGVSFIDIGRIIAQHHERIDGHGYPNGLEGEAICLEAQIIAVADSYDAMTSDRPYRKGMSHEEATAELKRCAGTHYEWELVKAFVKMMEDRQT